MLRSAKGNLRGLAACRYPERVQITLVPPSSFMAEAGIAVASIIKVSSGPVLLPLTISSVAKVWFSVS
jgi:hypothetical protein